MKIIFGFCFVIGVHGGKEDFDFSHLDGVVSKKELDQLNSLTEEDRVFLMEIFMKKMDVDADDILEANEIHTWIHYVEQMRVYNDVNTHVSYAV